MDNETDLRNSVATNGNRSMATTPGATPSAPTTPAAPYGAIESYGVPPHQRGLALSAGDMLAGLFVALIILGPLVTGVLHSH